MVYSFAFALQTMWGRVIFLFSALTGLSMNPVVAAEAGGWLSVLVNLAIAYCVAAPHPPPGTPRRSADTPGRRAQSNRHRVALKPEPLSMPMTLAGVTSYTRYGDGPIPSPSIPPSTGVTSQPYFSPYASATRLSVASR